MTRLLHEHGALAFWDFAAAAPYVDIQMNPRTVSGEPGDPAERNTPSSCRPIQFIGGPGTPGVLVVSGKLLTNAVPDVVGGRTVSYVGTDDHQYLTNLEHREEAGTPAIIESIRAGLVFGLKDAVGLPTILAYEHDFLHRAITAWNDHPAIKVLGNPAAQRLSIVSFMVKRPGGRYLHHNAVVAILNDLFGIQSRGGCSCAGPYGHRLLAIDSAQSHEFEKEVLLGCEGIKPGWVRVNFNYFISEDAFRYVVQAVAMVAEHGWKLLPEYRFEPANGLWHHRNGPVDPPLRLSQLRYDDDGILRFPISDDRAPENARADAPTAAAALFENAPDVDPGTASLVNELGTEFEDLRWFDLPAACLA